MSDADAMPLAERHTVRTEANSRLTAMAGAALFVLLAVQGITILRIGPLLSVHVVVGFVLLGPLSVKLGSTGWRFVRYYSGDVEYGQAGPPRPLLRVLAPVIVVSTVVVFASGIGLLAIKPGGGSVLVFVHKASFVLWFAVTTVHVLAYALPALRWCLADLAGRGPAEVVISRRARGLVLSASLVVGLVLGLAGLEWAQRWLTARR
ncbi:MAG: hypothetical protein QOK06_1277 [Acidimicrobiaceae bacterium]